MVTVIESPSNLVVTEVTSTSVSVAWDHARGRRDDYLVTVMYPGSAPISVETTDNSATIPSLPSFVTVDIAVQARYVVPQSGDEVLSNPLSIQQRTDGDSKSVVTFSIRINKPITSSPCLSLVSLSKPRRKLVLA